MFYPGSPLDDRKNELVRKLAGRRASRGSNRGAGGFRVGRVPGFFGRGQQVSMQAGGPVAGNPFFDAGGAGSPGFGSISPPGPGGGAAPVSLPASMGGFVSPPPSSFQPSLPPPPAYIPPPPPSYSPGPSPAISPSFGGGGYTSPVLPPSFFNPPPVLPPAYYNPGWF